MLAPELASGVGRDGSAMTASMSVLSDQVALITGCSTGIGRALAAECARRGLRVHASARRPEALADMASERLCVHTLDVTSEASIEKAVSEVVAHSGRIDILINNAGLNTIGPLPEVPLAAVRTLFDTNVIGLIAVTQAVFPHMARARRGRIINIGSVVGLLATPFAGPYCASKAAVHALSESLRMEAAPFGIDVVVVQPGGVRSRIAETGSQALERYRSPDALFAPFAGSIDKRAGASQRRPMDTDAFAAVVLDQALRADAPRVIRAGRGSRFLPVVASLPAPARERMLTTAFGLDRKL